MGEGASYTQFGAQLVLTVSAGSDIQGPSTEAPGQPWSQAPLAQLALFGDFLTGVLTRSIGQALRQNFLFESLSRGLFLRVHFLSPRRK